MSKTLKRIAIILVIALVTPMILNYIPSAKDLTTAKASAAEAKSKLISTDIAVGINSSPEYIYIDNYNAIAEYTYVSANEKVAIVAEYGAIKGIAKGKTTISVTETINGVATELGTVNVTVGDAKITEKSINVGLNSEDLVPVRYTNYDATYKYKSSNTKIAKVDSYGVITGVKLGKTTITVTETLKGKTKKIGTIKVNIINSKIAEKELNVAYGCEGYSSILIAYMNSKATYKYTSANTKIAKVDQYGLITGVKVGKTTISVSETYNKKTRKLGSVTVNVINSYINPDTSSIVLGINSSNYLNNVIDLFFYNWNGVYTCESADTKIVKAGFKVNAWGENCFMIDGVGLGETTITIYETYKGVKRTVGTVDVVVKEIPVTGIKFVPYEFDEESYYIPFFMENDYSGFNMKYYLVVEPYNTTSTFTFKSSDEKVIKVGNDGTFTILAEGVATITATCGDYTSTVKVVVKPGSDYYEGDY